MSMSFAHRRFRPTLVPTLLVIAMVPGLISLGFWQLRRAEEKRVLIKQFAEGAATTQALTTANATKLPAFQTVIVNGHYDSHHQILLDNMPLTQRTNNQTNYQTGYHVLTPLLTDGGIVLIDRGWVPLGATREQLPDVLVSEQPRTIRGRLADLPRAGVHINASPNTATWPIVMLFPTHDELRAVLGKTLLPKIVLLDPTEVDGMQRDWSNRYSFGEFGPERHIAYAVQWFGLAATLAILYLLSQFRKPSDDQSQ